MIEKATTMHNIEKSAFRKGEFVGCTLGAVWRIKRTKRGGDMTWKASRQTDGKERVPYTDQIWASSLAKISTKLATITY